MQLGEVGNAGAAANGKPLDGVRVLALEAMQSLPYCTQLLARLGGTGFPTLALERGGAYERLEPSRYLGRAGQWQADLRARIAA